MKQTAPLIFGFIIGMIMFLQYFIPKPPFTTAYSTILDWKQVVFGMTLILGIFSLLRYHVRHVQRRSEAWSYSVVTLVGFIVMVLGALFQGTDRGVYSWFFNHVQSPMQATLFSLLAFYVASASYRAFRARSLEAGLLLLAGIIVMLGRVPVGDLVQFDLGGTEISLSSISTWILDVPNLATKRGILIGVGLGVVATALKILLGIERTYLGKGA